MVSVNSLRFVDWTDVVMVLVSQIIQFTLLHARNMKNICKRCAKATFLSTKLSLKPLPIWFETQMNHNGSHCISSRADFQVLWVRSVFSRIKLWKCWEKSKQELTQESHENRSWLKSISLHFYGTNPKSAHKFLTCV